MTHKKRLLMLFFTLCPLFSINNQSLTSQPFYLTCLFSQGYNIRSQVFDRCIASGDSYLDIMHGLQQYIAMGFPPSKLYSGVSFTGQSWICVPSPLTGEKAKDDTDVCFVGMLGGDGFRGVNCSDATGFIINYDAANRILRKKDEIGVAVTSKRFEQYMKSSYFNWIRKEDGELIQTWLKDVESLSPIYAAAKKLGLGGIGIWLTTNLDYSSNVESQEYKDSQQMWEAFDILK